MCSLINECVCGNNKFESAVSLSTEYEVYQCTECGTRIQDIPFSEVEYDKWMEDYHKKEYTHTKEHDLVVAKLRIEEYQLNEYKGKRMLDFGSGNNAFVEVSRKVGINAYGCDPFSIEQYQYHYKEDLLSVHFPTDYFDVITMNDVLEHLVHPVSYLEELHRSLKQDGILFIDYPDFAHKHHWRKYQHIWMLPDKVVCAMMEKIGFTVEKIFKPISSKVVFKLKKKRESRIKILVPSGIGDCYWSLLKAKGFIKNLKEKNPPDVYATHVGKAPDRSMPFIEKLPFVCAKGYVDCSVKDPLWREAYMKDGHTVFSDAYGCDYFIAYNGVTRFGKSLEEVDVDFGTDWNLDMFVSWEEREAYRKYKEQYGDFYVGYFIPHGMYTKWLIDFSPVRIKRCFDMLYEKTGKKIILIGAKWDIGFGTNVLGADGKNVIDLSGQTTLDECFAIMKASSGILGFPSGVTILATKFRVPSVLFWNKYFDERFWRNSCPPYAYDEGLYKPVNTAKVQVDEVVNSLIGMTK